MGSGSERLIADERAPFHTLVKLIEHELELVEAGDAEALQAAIDRTGEYLETLPDPAPESALPLVLHAEAMRGRVIILAEQLRDQLDNSRRSLLKSREIARTYGAPRGRSISTNA